MRTTSLRTIFIKVKNVVDTIYKLTITLIKPAKTKVKNKKKKYLLCRKLEFTKEFIYIHTYIKKKNIYILGYLYFFPIDYR